MKNKISHYIYIIAPIAIILVIVIVSIKFLLPMMFGINNKLTELESIKERLVRLQTKRATLETVTSVYSDLLADATLALPSEKNAETILTAMENISGNTQYAIDSVSLNPGAISTESAKAIQPDIKRGSPFLPLNIRAQGLTQGFPNFLNYLQNSRRLFDITNLNISFSNENNNVSTVDLQLNAYYLPPVAEIGAVDADLPKITEIEQKLLGNLAQMPITTEIAAASSSGNVSTGKANLFTW